MLHCCFSAKLICVAEVHAKRAVSLPSTVSGIISLV